MKKSPLIERNPEQFRPFEHLCPECGDKFLGAGHEVTCSVACSHARHSRRASEARAKNKSLREERRRLAQ